MPFRINDSYGTPAASVLCRLPLVMRFYPFFKIVRVSYIEAAVQASKYVDEKARFHITNIAPKLAAAYSLFQTAGRN